MLYAILLLVSHKAFTQTINKSEFEDHLEDFEKNFRKEKYKRAAKSFEWLFNVASYDDQDFIKNGLLLYDYLYVDERDNNQAKYYKNMLDTLKSLTDKSIEEVLVDRFDEYGYSHEPEDLKPIVTIMPDINPQYPEGLEAFLTYISDHIQFPSILKKYGTSSKVLVEFVIDDVGKVINVRIVRGITKEVDQKIIEVVKSSPDWAPGKKDGKPVPVKMILPISFGYK